MIPSITIGCFSTPALIWAQAFRQPVPPEGSEYELVERIGEGRAAGRLDAIHDRLERLDRKEQMLEVAPIRDWRPAGHGGPRKNNRDDLTV